MRTFPGRPHIESPHPLAFTVQYRGRVNGLPIEIGVSEVKAYKGNAAVGVEYEEVRAIIDTGATSSMITSALVRKI